MFRGCRSYSLYNHVWQKISPRVLQIFKAYKKRNNTRKSKPIAIYAVHSMPSLKIKQDISQKMISGIAFFQKPCYFNRRKLNHFTQSVEGAATAFCRGTVNEKGMR